VQRTFTPAREIGDVEAFAGCLFDPGSRCCRLGRTLAFARLHNFTRASVLEAAAAGSSFDLSPMAPMAQHVILEVNMNVGPSNLHG
jgi:hypothetical protein